MEKVKNLELLQAQLTIARWYVDRATDGSEDVRRRYVAYARETFYIIDRLVPTLTLDADERRETDRELTTLRARLEVAVEAPEPEPLRKSD